MYAVAASRMRAATAGSPCSGVAYPIRLRWYRAASRDAAVALPDGRTVGIVRRGLTSDRTAFSKQMWRLRDGQLPGAVLVLMPDEVRLRHARRMLTGAPVPFFLALEREAVAAALGDPVWSPPAVNAAIDLRSALDRVEPGSELPAEPELSRASLPADLAVEGPGWAVPDHMLPTLLKPAEKRALDLVSDWPWIAMTDLAGLLGVSVPRASQLVNPLEGFRLVARPRDAGRRLALTDRGLTLLAQQGPHLRRRGEEAVERRSRRTPNAPFEWRNVSGRQEPPAAQEHRAHRSRPRLHCGPGEAGGLPGMGDRPARPAPKGFPPLPARRRDALRPPGRLWRPAQRPRDVALLPGVGTARRAARNHVGAARPLSALPSHLTGPSTTTTSGPPSWSSSTTTSRPPTSCAWRGRRCRRRA